MNRRSFLKGLVVIAALVGLPVRARLVDREQAQAVPKEFDDWGPPRHFNCRCVWVEGLA
jgi:hypothetical protein